MGGVRDRGFRAAETARDRRQNTPADEPTARRRLRLELLHGDEARAPVVAQGEESYGLMIGDQIRDKDAISAVAILCEMAAYEKSQGRSLYQKLIDLYVEYGCYQEHLISITKKGMNGQQQIADMMDRFRTNPPKQLGGSKVVELLDYQLQKKTKLETGTTEEIMLPKSNVLQFILEDGSKISARPSGTEPKIKFYFSVRTELSSADKYEAVKGQLMQKIETVIKEMAL